MFRRPMDHVDGMTPTDRLRVGLAVESVFDDLLTVAMRFAEMAHCDHNYASSRG